MLKNLLPSIPKNSGVYKFLDQENNVLYVGKAKNLFKRLSSYTNKNQLSTRILRMITLAVNVEYIITTTEIEALLLEHNLIKKLSPNFNILLKDDKSFPQIQITNHKFPQITKYRGLKNNKGLFFGPFVNASDVNRTIDILRKNFQLRNCSDQEFKSRQKPCLEYQIKKCSAPCVSMIACDEYKKSVEDAVAVLSGKSTEIIENFRQQMNNCSKNLEFEKALIFRDKIKSLENIQFKQHINFDKATDFDIIIVVKINQRICIYISFYRLGQNYGSKPYFYEINNDDDISKLLADFIGQIYLYEKSPNLILTNIEIAERQLMMDYLSKINNKKVEIHCPKAKEKLNLVRQHYNLAAEILQQKISHNLSNKKILMEIKKIFDLDKIPQIIEVYDNSHTANQNAVGAMICSGVDGFIKSRYRKFNIKKISDIDNDKKNILRDENDDTAMLEQVLLRRFSKVAKKDLPDLIIIDGGKGQLSSAQKIFNELKINIPFICMSKGKERNAGNEYFHQIDKDSFNLEKNSPILYYLQRLRDEAHRFAISTHRIARGKKFIPQ